jgi:hypothetical protein
LFGRLLALVALAIASLAAAARADTIKEFLGGTFNLHTTAGIYSQWVTTPSGGPWTNITFNFYEPPTPGTPYAIGNLYLLDHAYAGAPSSLSSSSYIGVAAASGGTSWVFDPSVTLQANTQYYFYMDTPSDASHLLFSTAANTDTAYYYSDPVWADISSPDGAFNFTLSGTPTGSPGPLPGAGLLSYLVAGCTGLAACRKKLGERTASLLAAMKRTLPDLWPEPGVPTQAAQG